jgi:tetratricopeptide (TPR) repeat protein
MVSLSRSRSGIITLIVLFLCASCAYYNTFYNAKKSYDAALELARLNPDNPVSSEERLLDEAVSGAVKILTVYPESRWVDDAQLLLGDALLLSGRRTLTGSGTSDFNEAMRAYASALVMTDDQDVRDHANTGMGLAAVELGRLNDAIASFESVSRNDSRLYVESRLYLIETCLLAHQTARALEVVDSLGIPRNDSLAAELTLLKGRVFMETGLPDSGAVLALSAGEMFGRGDGYYRALSTAAEAYIQTEDPERAVDVLDRLLAGYRSDIETAAIALLNGKARELTGDSSGAIFSYRSAADIDRYREYGAEALYLRAFLLEREDRIEDALEDLDELSSRSGNYLWIRLAEDRLKDLQLLQEYMAELESGDDPEEWLYRIMIAEKRIDLYGNEDTDALAELIHISLHGPDMERALAMLTLSEILPVDEDSSMSLVLEAYSLADAGDLATTIEDRLGLPRGPGYNSRPSVILEESWELIDAMAFSEAWMRLDQLLSSTWSRMIRPEILWAAYVAGEGARMDDTILEAYLNELVEDYPETDFGIAARDRLGGDETGGE